MRTSPPAVRKVRQEMREIAKYALKIGYSNARAVGNKLQIDDKVYYEDELYLLPIDLHLSNIKTRPIGGGIGFQSEHSYMSNFYPCQIRMHQSVFASAEQAFFYHKAIICEREEAGNRLKELDDPKTIKSKGDKIPTCEDWERSKVAVMKNILRQKFIQNPELKAKLMGTYGTPLLECTNNKFWGTGWFLDDPQWKETNIYPGKNVLGKLLEEIRESFDLDVLNSTEAIAGLEPMDVGPVKVDDASDAVKQPPMSKMISGQVEDSKVPKTPVLSEGVVAFASVKKCSTNKSTVKEMSKLIAPTTLEQSSSRSTGTDTEASRDKDKDKECGLPNPGAKTGAVGADEIADADNFDAISFTSSIFSDGSDSFDARNVTLPNGRLDVEKLMGWSLPTVNLSRVLERSSRRSPGTREKIMKLIDAQMNKTNPSTSMPAVGNISTIRPKRKKRDMTSIATFTESTEGVSEKESIRRMLEDIKNTRLASRN